MGNKDKTKQKLAQKPSAEVADAKTSALHECLLAIDVTDTTDALWQCLIKFITETMGAEILSYHHVPPRVAPDRNAVTILTHGFDPSWGQTYREKNFLRFDPIAQRAAHALNAFRWSEVEQSPRLTSEQKDYMKQLRGWMHGDGLTIPAYGPSSRNAHFGVGCRAGAPDWSRIDELYIIAACQAFHIRYCVLRMGELGRDFELTPTETAILDGLRLGCSITVIAAGLRKRPDTVEAVLSLIQKKMGVTDTGSAILRAISCGLLTADDKAGDAD